MEFCADPEFVKKVESVWIWIEYPDKPEEYGVNCSVSDDSFTNGNDQLQDIVSLIQKEVKYVNIMTGAQCYKLNIQSDFMIKLD